MSEIDALLADDMVDLVRMRHDLHAHPQLGYEETYASDLVRRCLQDWGIPHCAGIAETGVVAWIDPSHAGARQPALGLRADLDALPIQEETGLPYASRNAGLMHACGHDGHTSVLLGAARILWRLRSKLPCPVKLVFQPAEENGAGAQRMIEAGTLSDRVGGRRVSAMFGLHGTPLLPVGTYATMTGALLAGCCDFEIVIHGTGGHAAMPHHSTDPVVASAVLISSAQSLVSRECDATHSAVLSFCSIHGGDASNVIPENVRLVGTIRTLEDSIFEQLRARLKAISEAIAALHGCRAEVRFVPSYPSVINDARATGFAVDVAESVCGAERVHLMDRACMASEDFAFYSRVVPSCFGFIGLIAPGRDRHPMLHTPQFDFTDATLETGVRLMCSFALHGDRVTVN